MDFLTINDQLAIMKLMKAKACCCPGVAVERTGMWTSMSEGIFAFAHRTVECRCEL
jgi:hypothetical protein